MTTPTATKPADPLALLRTRRYLALLVLAAILGVPIAAVAYFFLKLVDVLQKAVFTQLPSGLGFHGEPLWWPLLPLALAGLLVALAIRYLPGTSGHSPADGFKPRGAITPAEIPGVFLAALATLALGAVLGPEAPLIALGGGLAVLAVRFRQRDMPAQTLAMGMGAMAVTMLRLPLTSVLLATLLLASDGLAVTPLVIVAVVIAYVITIRINPPAATQAAAEPAPAPRESAPVPPAGAGR